MKRIIITTILILNLMLIFSKTTAQTDLTKNSWDEIVKLQSNFRSNYNCLKLVKREEKVEYTVYEDRQVGYWDDPGCYGCVSTYSFRTESVPVIKKKTVFYSVLKNICTQPITILGITKLEDYSGTIYFEDRSIKLEPGEMTEDELQIEPSYDPQNAKIGSTHFYRTKLLKAYLNLTTNKSNKVGLNNSQVVSNKVNAKKIDDNRLIIDSYTNTTDIHIKTGDEINITASGNVTFGAWAGSGGPEGINGYTNYNRIPGFKHGSLLVRVGENSEWRAVGTSMLLTALESGVLEFMINDSDPSNNNGAFHIKLQIVRAQ